MSSLPACCTDFDISLNDLFFPERMTQDGWEFIQAHDISRMTLIEIQSRSIDMGNGTVKIKHRCAQLQDDGRCGIYATRPQLCRGFDCSTKPDCFCGGHGNKFIPTSQVIIESTPLTSQEDDGEPEPEPELEL